MALKILIVGPSGCGQGGAINFIKKALESDPRFTDVEFVTQGNDQEVDTVINVDSMMDRHLEFPEITECHKNVIEESNFSESFNYKHMDIYNLNKVEPYKINVKTKVRPNPYHRKGKYNK